VAPDETGEVVIWPSIWRAFLIKCFLLWFLTIGIFLGALLLLDPLIGTGPPPFSSTPIEVILTFHGLWLLTLVAGFYLLACGRVCMTAEGIRAPNVDRLRGRIVYSWNDIKHVELVRKWYGRWLLVTTARKRFFYLEANVTSPAKFIEAVDFFAGSDNVLAVSLKEHLRGWWWFPFLGDK
jgi:hypothetical protein